MEVKKTLFILFLVLQFFISQTGLKVSEARNYQITGALDSRFMFSNNDEKINKDNFILHGVELNFKYFFQGESGDWGTLVLQAAYSPDFDFFSREFNYHYGDKYFVLKGPRGKINFKIGKFVVPFGNLQYYVSHLLILQPMFQRSLGLREDIGFEINGYLKDFDYDISFTNGRPDSRINFKNEWLFICRIGRNLGDLRYGISGLSGGAPQGDYATHLDGMFGIMKKEEKVKFVHKNRVNLDFQYPLRQVTFRGELVGGKDKKKAVWGFYSGMDYEIFSKLLLSLKYNFWNPDKDNSDYLHETGAGLNYKFNRFVTTRIAYERGWQKDNMGMKEKFGLFTTQLNLNF
jgi:hypothetical protein